MYMPKVFQEADRERLYDFVDAHGFGALIVPDAQGDLEISHLPFFLDRSSGRLLAHVARANPIWKKALAARSVVVVFQGPHGYVSARWYEEPQKQVPTWNYAVVHAHGRAEGPMPQAELAALLDDLVATHEQGAAAPWRARDVDRDFFERLLQEIVGFSIVIERLEGKFKLSQNRSPEDRTRVIRALAERGREDDREMVALMTRAPRGKDSEPG